MSSLHYFANIYKESISRKREFFNLYHNLFNPYHLIRYDRYYFCLLYTSIETEQYYLNILLEDLKPIVSDLRNTHMKDSNTASDIDYQSMVKNIIDDFTSPTQIATEDTPEASNDAYINGLLLLFCKNLEMKITQLSVEEKQILKEIFSRSKPAKEHRKLRRRNPKL